MSSKIKTRHMDDNAKGATWATFTTPAGLRYLGEVGGLASLVLGDLVHRVLGALLALAEGAPLLGYVHHLYVWSRPRGQPMKAHISVTVMISMMVFSKA